MFLNTISNKQFYWFIIVCSVIAFFPVFSADFVYYDDPEYVINNPYIKNISWSNIKEIFKGKATILYVPLTTISYQIEYSLYGLNPLGFHFVNLLLHILNAALLFKILLKLNIKSTFLVYLAVIVFTLHPMVTESVCWITERKDVLYCFFYFLAAYNFLKFYESQKLRDYLLTLLFFVLACFAKPMAINLPVLMVLYVLYVEKRLDLKKLIYYVPFVIISAAFAYVSIISIKHGATGKINISGYDVSQKIFLFVSEIGYYFFRPFYPFGNRLFHLFPSKEEIFTNKVIVIYFALCIILFVTVLYKWFKQKDRLLLFIFAAWLVVLLPILQIYPNTHSFVSERYFYVSIIFPFIIIVKLMKLDRNEIKTAGVYLVLIAGTFALLSYIRSTVWKNTETLMLSELKPNPKNALALNNLGYYYHQKGNYKLAIEKLRIAVATDTTNAFYLNNYGWALGANGNLDSAVYYFKKANTYKRDYFDAMNNLAITYCMQDNFMDAKIYFSKAEAVNPEHPELLYNLGAYYLKQGDKNAAKGYFIKAFEKGNKKAQKYLNI
jgi:Flp pilus assembly protein TadD